MIIKKTDCETVTLVEKANDSDFEVGIEDIKPGTVVQNVASGSYGIVVNVDGVKRYVRFDNGYAQRKSNLDTMVKFRIVKTIIYLYVDKEEI